MEGRNIAKSLSVGREREEIIRSGVGSYERGLCQLCGGDHDLDCRLLLSIHHEMAAARGKIVENKIQNVAVFMGRAHQIGHLQGLAGRRNYGLVR